MTDNVSYPNITVVTVATKKRQTYLQKKKAKQKRKKTSCLPFLSWPVNDEFQWLDNPHKLKLSQALIELVEPFQDGCPEDPLLYMLGLIAWNSSIKPELRDSFPIPDGLNQSEIEDFESLIDALIARKLALFPHENRLMIDFFFDEDPDGDRTLIVTSSDPVFSSFA